MAAAKSAETAASEKTGISISAGLIGKSTSPVRQLTRGFRFRGIATSPVAQSTRELRNRDCQDIGDAGAGAIMPAVYSAARTP